jgi:hypothetical protein
MKAHGLIAALGVLAILGGYAWWANRHPAADTANATPASPKLLNIPADQITGFRIAKAGADPVTLVKQGDQWQITTPKPLGGDSDAATALANAVSPLVADRLIDEHPASLASFGLDNPSNEVDITTKDGKTQKVLLGSDTPSGSDTYTKLDGDAKVYTVASSTKAGFDKSLNDLRDKRLLPVNADKIAAVKLAAKGEPIEFGKNSGGDWQIVKPKPLRADNSAVDDLVGRLKDAKMDLSATASPSAADFNTGTKVGSATLTDDKGSQTLEVRKLKDGSYLAKTTATEGIYKIGNDTGAALEKGIDDFRNKKLFDFGFTDPSKLDLSGKIYEKNGDKWFQGSAQVDSGSVQAVIDKLRDLAGTKLGDKIAGVPTLALAVTWGDKGKVDKVVIDKNGADYIGTRENDPTAYVMDSKSFDDLQGAIGAIKPAATPKADTKK